MSLEPTETPIGEPAGVPGDFTLADMEFLALGDDAMLVRPCVDCGVQTGRMCDHCYAVDRIPSERWAEGQLTPLCSRCDNKHDACHFCRGLDWCRPEMRSH